MLIIVDDPLNTIITMSKITYIKPVKESNSDNGTIEVHSELLNSDIDILSEQEQDEHSDVDYDANNIFGY